jgi:hypothetical protein
MPAIGLGLSAGSSIAGVFGQQSAANADANYQNKLYGQTAQLAIGNYLQQTNALQIRSNQQTDAAGDQAVQNELAGTAARATASTAAGESGVTGNSVATLLNDFSAHEAYNNANLHRQLYWEQQQGYQDMLSARAQAAGNIASATPRPVAPTNWLGAGLQIAGAGLGAFDQFQFRSHAGPYKNNL